MNHSNFKNLVNNIPSIEVSLNWCYDEGQGKFDKDVEVDNLIIVACFSCYQTKTTDLGDRWTPPYSELDDNLSISELEINVYNEEGDTVKLSAMQKIELSNKIESNIISN